MSEKDSGDIQLRNEPIVAKGPFIFSLAPKEIEGIVRNSELAKRPPESGGADQPENLYERRRGIFGISTSHKESSAVRRIANGEFTGKLLSSSEVVLMLGEEIGAGDTGKVYLCRNIGNEKLQEDNIVVKVCIPNQDYNQDHEQDHRVKVIKSEIEALRLHNDDDPPVIPKYFGSGVIDGHPAYAMELMRDPTIDERITQGGLFSIKEALNAISPFLDLLRIEEGHGRTASDFKTENIRVAKNPKEDGKEYFRYLDYGLVPMGGLGQTNIRYAIARMAGFVYFTVRGRNPGPDIESNIFLLPNWKLNMDLLKHQEFQSLPIGLRAILLKGLGFLDGGYNTFTDFDLDLALLDISLKKNIAKTQLPDYQPSDLIRRAITASVEMTEVHPSKKPSGLSIFRKQKVEPPVSHSKQLMDEMERMLSAARPAEVIESEDKKRYRLIDWRKWQIHSFVCGSIVGRSVDSGIINRFDEYLSVFQDDQEAVFYRDILLAIDAIYKSNISYKDGRFFDSYADYLISLTVSKDGRNELLPFDKLKESAKPLIELADKLKAMAEVSDSEEKVPELTLQELIDIVLTNGRLLDEFKRKSKSGNLKGIGPYAHQTALDLIGKAINVLDTMESRGVKFVTVAGDKITIEQIRARVQKDLQDLS